MDITVIEAKKFVQRSDLEAYVRSQFGLTGKEKINVVISGTKHDLANLGLSKKMIFWGIACVEVNADGSGMIHGEDPKISAAVDRGPTTPFGINGSTSKPTGL